jgi:hypothetical protein
MDDQITAQGNTGATEPPISGRSGRGASKADRPVGRRRKRDLRKSPYDNGKTRLLTLDDLDRRTLAAQRALALQDKLISERGGVENLSALRVEVLRSVSVLTAMVEHVQAQWLLGEQIDVAAIATIINARRREAELIGLDPLPKDVSPDLRDYLVGARSEGPAAPGGKPVDSSAAAAATPPPAGPEKRASESARPSVQTETQCNGTGT